MPDLSLDLHLHPFRPIEHILLLVYNGIEAKQLITKSNKTLRKKTTNTILLCGNNTVIVLLFVQHSKDWCVFCGRFLQ